MSVQRSELMVGPLRLEGFLAARLQACEVGANGVASGQIHRNGQWEPIKGLHPAAVIDMLPPGVPRHQALARWLESHPHNHVPQENDRELLAILLRQPDLQAFIAPSVLFESPDSVFQMLKVHGAVTVKHSYRRLGEPIMIQTVGSQFHVWEARLKHEWSRHQLERWLSQRVSQDLMVQAYIANSTTQGRSYSLQATVQQRGDGVWMTPTLQCFIATETPFASLWADAEHIGTPFSPLWEDLVFPRDHPGFSGLQARILGLAMVLACRLQSQWGMLNPGVLSFRLVIDENLQPWVIGVDGRPAAPMRAARNLEFFKHWTELALNLSKDRKARDALAEHQPSKENSPHLTARDTLPASDKNLCWPLRGVSIRGQLLNEQAETLLAGSARWLDVGLDPGSRYFLSRFSQGWRKRNVSKQPWLSLRLGTATADQADAQGRWTRLNPLEDYAGRGLLCLSELRLMRSVRLPLLQFQWKLMNVALDGLQPELIWLDDVDLGLRALPSADQFVELQRSQLWLQDLVHQGAAKGWGMIFYNASATQTQAWVRQATLLARDKVDFLGVHLRGAVALELVEWLAKQGVQWVTSEHTASLNLPGIQAMPNLSLYRSADAAEKVRC